MIGTLSGVEPRHLATLAAVGEAGTFKAAAERLGYVQSAVSQQIAQLEAAVGGPVVARLPGQPLVTLTETGGLLARHADGILAQLDAAAADLRMLERDGELRVGIGDRVAMHALPRALELLRVRAPEVRLDVRDRQEPPSARAHDVRRGVLDAALDDLPVSPGPFTSHEVLRDPIVLVVHRDARLAGAGQLSGLAELEGVELVADDSWPMLALIESQLRAAGVEPRFVVQSRLSASVQALVAAGIGAALMPALAVDYRDPEISVVGLGDLIPPRRIGLYWHAQRRRLTGLDRFREALLAACDELERAAAARCAAAS